MFYPIGMFALSGENTSLLTSLRDHMHVSLAAESLVRRVTAVQSRPVSDQLWGLDRVDTHPLNYDNKISLNGDGEGVDVYVVRR